MQPYQAEYFKSMRYDLDDLGELQSEISGLEAADIHHLKAFTSMRRQSYPCERLIMLTREEHSYLGDKKCWQDYLFWVHIFRMSERQAIINYQNLPRQIVPDPSSDSQRFVLYYTFFDWIVQNNYMVRFEDLKDGVRCDIVTIKNIPVKSYKAETKEELIEGVVKLIEHEATKL